ncbi:glycosyltransferase family 2 protein [Flavobacterium sp.]|uniref:glycosyltransferase family 2 protein n=1 Tax=Flavobacterium sp. TaxID=239 RepID=UPI002A83749F|nr:glycosyltransferase family 2 protein [Flavobacterium sp.]
MNKSVFVIIVTYNGAKWLKKCFQSLEQSHYENNIIVVDNNSSDNSVEIIQSFPKIQLIQSADNLGFGKANNIGIQKGLELGADYVFLLNQDTWVFSETISNLVEVAETNEQYGIVSPLHYSGDEIHLDASFEMYWKRKIKSISENVDEVPFVNAAAWLISKRVILEVGYFEPMFQHYGEDRNYTDRILFHKYKTVVVKNSKICHDRIITRNFKKDCKQAKFKIQAEVLNVNNNLIVSYLKGFKSVLGLPKYFLKFYSLPKVFNMFCQLLGYFILLKFHFFTIFKARKSYK